MYKPPFQVTSLILDLVKNIAIELGVLKGAKLYPTPMKLRKKNKVKTIQSSLAIEGNTLSLDQITTIMDGRKVIGDAKEVQEVKNAVAVYNDLSKWNPISIKDFQEAHTQLMKDLIRSKGIWRKGGVGVFKDKQISHIAPPAKRVKKLMLDLFQFIAEKNKISWLIKACIFHYELEFIHPFEDGNGRMGRLWQQLLLIKENVIFEFLSVETMIREHQAEYYKALEESDREGESTIFIEFSLQQILKTVKEYTKVVPSQIRSREDRLEYARKNIRSWFTRKQYMECHKDISTSTASRDLREGIKDAVLVKKGKDNQVHYKFINNNDSADYYINARG